MIPGGRWDGPPLRHVDDVSLVPLEGIANHWVQSSNPADPIRGQEVKGFRPIALEIGGPTPRTEGEPPFTGLYANPAPESTTCTGVCGQLGCNCDWKTSISGTPGSEAEPVYSVVTHTWGTRLRSPELLPAFGDRGTNEVELWARPAPSARGR